MAFNYKEMMKQARMMQRQMEEIQDELKNTVFEASSGGGAVKVKVNGDQEVLEIKISKDVVDPDTMDMLEDMVLVAINDAINQAKQESREKMAGLTGGINIPGI